MKNSKPYVCYKIFTIGQHEKEEQWLNEMAAKGMLLRRASGLRYEFEEGVAGSYEYRLEFLKHVPNHPESVAYLKFLEENDIELVGSYLRWIYVRKASGHDNFELYSDSSSRYEHYKRIFSTSLIALVLSVVACLNLFRLNLMDVDLGVSIIFIPIVYLLLTSVFGFTCIRMWKRMKQIKKSQTIFDA